MILLFGKSYHTGELKEEHASASVSTLSFRLQTASIHNFSQGLLFSQINKKREIAINEAFMAKKERE